MNSSRGPDLLRGIAAVSEEHIRHHPGETLPLDARELRDVVGAPAFGQPGMDLPLDSLEDGLDSHRAGSSALSAGPGGGEAAHGGGTLAYRGPAAAAPD